MKPAPDRLCQYDFFQKERVMFVRRGFGWLTMCLVVGTHLFFGCGQSPVSQEPAEIPVATKKTIDHTVHKESASGDFSHKGGKLRVSFSKYAIDGETQVEWAELIVPKKALIEDTRITMKVLSGTSLEDIQVVFGPSGTSFVPSASLVLKLSGSDKPENLVVYHYSADQVSDAVIEKESGWKVRIEVPGFSRYSLGGDR
jgi:hypothetical protein